MRHARVLKDCERCRGEGWYFAVDPDHCKGCCGLGCDLCEPACPDCKGRGKVTEVEAEEVCLRLGC